MTRLLIAGGLIVVAVVVALVLGRRRRVDPPTQPTYAVPAQLDRRDFARPDAPWLVVVFSSATCDSCAKTVTAAQVLDCAEVAVDDVEAVARADLHRRYRIDAVPIVVLADSVGVVRASFVGPPTATDLWAAVAEAREPGSSPEPDLGRN